MKIHSFRYSCLVSLFLSALILCMQGCSYTAAVSQTNIPADRGKVVKTSVYKFIFLGFNFDNDEVLRLTKQLQEKCPNGDVRGVLTKDIRTMYFLFFFWARETFASGFCQQHGKVAYSDDVIEPDIAKTPAEPDADAVRPEESH
ncbi:MAG: hypothetical protein HQK54_05370 [Oligoflexales bacterium]|nr:hypothetical protein [Oligoflexales bacterium]